MKPTNSEATSKKESISFINFNQDASCISVGTNLGYKIYSCDPFGKCYTCDNMPCSIVEMLYVTSLLAVVGIPDLPDNNNNSMRRLRIVNTKRQSTICELTFHDTILSVKMNRLRLVVVLASHIFVYDISSMRLLYTIDTLSNQHGLVALSSTSENNFLAYPSPNKNKTKPDISNLQNKNGNKHNDPGSKNTVSNTSNGLGVNNSSTSSNSSSASTSLVTGSTLTNLNGKHDNHHNSNSNNFTMNTHSGDIMIFDLTTLRPYCLIEAHKAQVVALALSTDGLLLATASIKGTIIRVFDIRTGEKLYQFRRGTYGTKIHSLCFSEDNHFLAVSSATETVHVFKLSNEFLIPTANPANSVTNSNANSVHEEPLIGRVGSDKEDSKSRKKSDSSYDDEEDDIDEEDEEEDEDEDEDIDGDFTQEENSSTNNKDVENAINDDDNGLAEEATDLLHDLADNKPIIDQTRLSVGRLLRKSSQSLGRRAAETMGVYLPKRMTSVLKPIRHFASLKIPSGQDKSIIAIKSLQEELPFDIKEKLGGNLQNLLEIVVVTATGLYLKYVLDGIRGGDCILLDKYLLLDS